MLDHIIEKPSEQSPTSTSYKACPSPPLFDNHNFDVVDKEDPISENVGACSNTADPCSDRRPILGINNEGVEAVTDTESDDDSVKKTETKVDIPLENHILCDPEPKSQSSSLRSVVKSSDRCNSDSREMHFFL